MYFNKGIQILRSQGLETFIKRSFYFLLNNIFVFKKYNFYKKLLHQSKNNNHLLQDSNFTLVIICEPSDIDKLIDNSFNFGFFQDVKRIKNLLSESAILFCVFYKKEWAHTSWLSITSGSSIDPFFQNLKNRLIGLLWKSQMYSMI